MAEDSYRVMLSSTFDDLEEHRELAIQAIRQQGLSVVAMEEFPLSAQRDVIGQSIEMVNSADAYLCILGQRYGEVRCCSKRNPSGVSTTALEFRRAQERDLPRAGIVLTGDYPLPANKFDFDEATRGKLEVLRAEVRSDRVAAPVSSESEFINAVHVAAHKLRLACQERDAIEASVASSNGSRQSSVRELPPPAPPSFHLVTPLSQGMPFVGRERELGEISTWALSSAPMLVVEAIGGMGKSMVTHRWASEHAQRVLPALAGRFWYSFYEEGASMRDFSVQALAYIENVPPPTFKSLNRHDLRVRLTQHLALRPWLLVLDGLERVLIAYHRYDAAQITDEEGDGVREGEERDPNLCIRPDDDEMLRDLASVMPSKILISTRNMPTALRLSGVGGVRAGVAHLRLTGLAGDDAERVMSNAGVSGDGALMRPYLEGNFGGHPLMVGVIAGLILEHAPAPGDFDQWFNDPEGANALNLTKVEGVVSKRNHVLKVALEGLEPDEWKLLGRLSFFSGAVPYTTLSAINPCLPPRPARVEDPKQMALRDERRREVAEAAYTAYLDRLQEWEKSHERTEAEHWLRRVLRLLQRRGLVTREPDAASYDLHPLVRGLTRAKLTTTDRAEMGVQTADYAREQAPRLLSVDSSAEDVDRYLEVARLLLLGGQVVVASRMLRTSGVAYACSRTGRSRALYEMVAQLLEPDLSAGRSDTPKYTVRGLANQLSIAASRIGYQSEFRSAALLNLKAGLEDGDLRWAVVALVNFSKAERSLGNLASAMRLMSLASVAASATNVEVQAIHALLLCELNIVRGELDWQRHTPLAELGSPSRFKGPSYLNSRVIGDKVRADRYAKSLTEDQVIAALAHRLVRDDVSTRQQILVDEAHLLRDQDAEARARGVFAEAIHLGREQDAPVYSLEAEYAASMARLGEHEEAREYADRLSSLREPPHLRLAELRLVLGDAERARSQALLAYPKAWADGPPFAFHWDLRDCRAVLKAVGEPEPHLPCKRPEDLPPFEFEEEVLEGVKKGKAEKA
ncbi:MAG: DUF4062 domain-containing protein [Pseudomonadota bacterium]